MLEGIIDCDLLGIVPDIPVEMNQLKKQNLTLTQSNRFLKGTLIVMSLSIGIYVISKIIHNERKEKEKRKRRV